MDLQKVLENFCESQMCQKVSILWQVMICKHWKSFELWLLSFRHNIKYYFGKSGCFLADRFLNYKQCLKNLSVWEQSWMIVQHQIFQPLPLTCKEKIWVFYILLDNPISMDNPKFLFFLIFLSVSLFLLLFILLVFLSGDLKIFWTIGAVVRFFPPLSHSKVDVLNNRMSWKIAE